MKLIQCTKRAHACFKAKKNSVEAHNRSKNILQPNFQTGDYVFVRREKPQHKLTFNGIGHRQIFKVLRPMVYIVEQKGDEKYESFLPERMGKSFSSFDSQEVTEAVIALSDRTESRLKSCILFWTLVSKMKSFGYNFVGMV